MYRNCIFSFRIYCRYAFLLLFQLENILQSQSFQVNYIFWDRTKSEIQYLPLCARLSTHQNHFVFLFAVKPSDKRLLYVLLLVVGVGVGVGGTFILQQCPEVHRCVQKLPDFLKSFKILITIFQRCV